MRLTEVDVVCAVKDPQIPHEMWHNDWEDGFNNYKHSGIYKLTSSFNAVTWKHLKLARLSNVFQSWVLSPHPPLTCHSVYFLHYSVIVVNDDRCLYTNMPWNQIFILSTSSVFQLGFKNKHRVRIQPLSAKRFYTIHSLIQLIKGQNITAKKLTILFNLWSCAASGTLRV